MKDLLALAGTVLICMVACKPSAVHPDAHQASGLSVEPRSVEIQLSRGATTGSASLYVTATHAVRLDQITPSCSCLVAEVVASDGSSLALPVQVSAGDRVMVTVTYSKVEVTPATYRLLMTAEGGSSAVADVTVKAPSLLAGSDYLDLGVFGSIPVDKSISVQLAEVIREGVVSSSSESKLQVSGILYSPADQKAGPGAEAEMVLRIDPSCMQHEGPISGFLNVQVEGGARVERIRYAGRKATDVWCSATNANGIAVGYLSREQPGIATFDLGYNGPRGVFEVMEIRVQSDLGAVEVTKIEPPESSYPVLMPGRHCPVQVTIRAKTDGLVAGRVIVKGAILTAGSQAEERIYVVPFAGLAY